MAHGTTAKIDDKGYLRIRVPAAVRKRLPADCSFKLEANDNSLTLTTKLISSKPDRDDDWSDFDAARASIRSHFREHKATMKDIVETRRKVRERRRAKSGGR